MFHQGNFRSFVDNGYGPRICEINQYEGIFPFGFDENTGLYVGYELRGLENKPFRTPPLTPEVLKQSQFLVLNSGPHSNWVFTENIQVNEIWFEKPKYFLFQDLEETHITSISKEGIINMDLSPSLKTMIQQGYHGILQIYVGTSSLYLFEPSRYVRHVNQRIINRSQLRQARNDLELFKGI